MYKILMGLMFLTIIGSGVIVFRGLSERARLQQETEKAKTMQQEADALCQESKAAGREAVHAVEQRKQAEDRSNQAQRDKEIALRKQKQAEANRDRAEAERAKALQNKEAAEKESARMSAELSQAMQKRDAMANERDKALADFEVEQEARQIAEQKRDELIELLKKASQELSILQEQDKLGLKTASLVTSLDNIMSACVDDGDGYFIRGLEASVQAQTPKDKLKAAGFINEAKEKYTEARTKLKKLTYLDDQTGKIIELAQESVDENVKTTEIIQKIQEGAFPDSIVQKKVVEAAERKEKADRLFIEVYEKLLVLIKAHPDLYFDTQKNHIQDLKRKIEKRLGISGDKQ